jgi:cytochrome b561
MRSEERYDRRSIALHWLTALFVGMLWLSAQFIDFFPKGPSRWNMLGVHMVTGVTLGVLIAARIAWRRSARSSRPNTGTPLARWFHLLLYTLVVCTVLLGLWNAWARGEHVFDLFQIPAFDPTDKAIRKWAGDQHKLVANALLLLSLAHATMGLAHHFIFKDGVLRRMLPERTS